MRLYYTGAASRPCAVELFHTAADAGNAVATAWLAWCYFHGLGVGKDEADGQRLARVALDERGLQALADQGDASAQHALGAMHYAGLGFAQDFREGVVWIRKAAQQGHKYAQGRLGEAYRFGEGVEQDHREAVVWLRKGAEQGNARAQCFLGEAYRDGDGTEKDECEAVTWLRKSAAQGDEYSQEILDAWDTALTDVTTNWQVIFDPDPRATVVEEDKGSRWLGHGPTAGDSSTDESLGDDAVLRRMSPWVLRCVLNAGALNAKIFTEDDIREAAQAACSECSCSVSAVTSTAANCDMNAAMRVRVLIHDAVAPTAPAPASADQQKRKADEVTHELALCCADGTSHKLAASPSTTVLEAKQHVRRALRGAAADDSAGAPQEQEQAQQPFLPFWQDEHAVQRLHIFMHGTEDELADARSMGSLGDPPALFALADTEASFMERLEAEAEVLRARLQGVKLRDLARCDAMVKAAAEAEAGAEGGAGGGGAGGASASGVDLQAHRTGSDA